MKTPPLSLAFSFIAALPLALVACGDATDDPQVLINKGDYAGALQVIDQQMTTVAKGTQDHEDLVIQRVWALSADEPEKARDAFVAFADAQKALVDASDFEFVVATLRKAAKPDSTHLLAAIDVMDKGKKLWPNDPKMDETLAAIQSEVANSGNDAAKAKMAGLGYM